MDDLEKAILIAYDPDAAAAAAADPALRARALAYCEGARSAADPSAVVRLCFDRLGRSPHPHVHFWCLQTLQDAVALRYQAIPASDLPFLRSSLLALASDRALPTSSPPFLKNKLAQALAALFRRESPGWQRNRERKRGRQKERESRRERGRGEGAGGGTEETPFRN